MQNEKSQSLQPVSTQGFSHIDQDYPMKMAVQIIFALFAMALMTSCAYNPLVGDNHTTGSLGWGAAGTAAGVGAVSAMGGTKPFMAVGGIAGGMFGYYMTTLRHDAAGIVRGGGKFYTVGRVLGIYIPSDRLFEPNSATLIPSARPILDSVAVVLARFPDNNIIISGNTSGFYRSKWEERLSRRRAKAVSAYLWNAGINNYKAMTNNFRKLNYVGYGDYFPIAANIRNDGIRANSRIQITSYPNDCDLKLDERAYSLRNVGSLGEGGDDIPSVNVCPNNASIDEGTGECVVND